MRLQLRPYQERGIVRVDDLRAQGHQRIVCVAPTGAGKTVFVAKMIETAVAQSKHAMFLAHRKELIDQSSGMLDYIGVPHGVLQGNHHRRRPEALVQVASVQTLAAMRLCESCKNKDELRESCNVCKGNGKLRSRKLPAADIIVVDEAHRVLGESYVKLLDSYPKATVIAITATPWRLDGRGLKRMFSEMVVFAEMRELIDEGFLLPMRVFGPKEPLNLREVNLSGGDYKNEQLSVVMRDAKLVGKIVENWQKLAENRLTVVFATNVAHSHDIVRRFVEAGVVAEHLDGETPKGERERILARLASGETRVVSNVDVLCEGWDLPQLGCVVLARPTLSITRYLQQTGRSSRPVPGMSYAVILDHADCARRHGLPDDAREWSLEDRERKSPAPKELHQCPKCGQFFNCTENYIDRFGKENSEGDIVAQCPDCRRTRQLDLLPELPEEIDDELVEHTSSPRPSAYGAPQKPTHGLALCSRCKETWVTVRSGSGRVRVTCNKCVKARAAPRPSRA